MCLKWRVVFSFFKMSVQHFGTNGILLVMLVEQFIFRLLHAFKQPLELPSDNIKQPLRCSHTRRLLLISNTLYGTTENCAPTMRQGVKW